MRKFLLSAVAIVASVTLAFAAARHLSDAGAGGTTFGQSAADLISFYNATPIAQPTNGDQAAVTDSSGGTKGATTAVVAVAMQQVFVVPVQLADFVNAGVWKVTVPFAGTVKSALFRTGKPASTSSKLATLTVTTNGGGAVTGGVMALTTANQNVTGTALAASAISGAGATITAGQTIEVTVSSVTAFVEGDGYVEFTVSNNDLANSIATIIAQTNRFRTDLVALGLLKGS